MYIYASLASIVVSLLLLELFKFNKAHPWPMWLFD